MSNISKKSFKIISFSDVQIGAQNAERPVILKMCLIENVNNI